MQGSRAYKRSHSLTSGLLVLRHIGITWIGVNGILVGEAVGALEDGRDVGLEDGRDVGLEDGCDVGFGVGSLDGFDDGREDGSSVGILVVLDDGLLEG